MRMCVRVGLCERSRRRPKEASSKKSRNQQNGRYASIKNSSRVEGVRGTGYAVRTETQGPRLLNEANSTSRRRLRELALGRVGRTRRSGSRNTRRRALRGPDQTPRHRSSRALNVARFPIFTADQTRCRGRGPGRAAVCRADEKQIEYKSRRMRRELATTPAWVLS